MARMSTSLKNALLDGDSLKATMDGGYIHIYAFDGVTTVPGPDDEVDTDADYMLLATIYSDGGTATAGLNFAASASGGIIQKASGETWDNSDAGNINAGTETAAFFVHTDSTESSGLNLVDPTPGANDKPRIVGTVGTVGADLNLSSVSLSNGDTQEITNYSVTVGQ